MPNARAPDLQAIIDHTREGLVGGAGPASIGMVEAVFAALGRRLPLLAIWCLLPPHRGEAAP